MSQPRFAPRTRFPQWLAIALVALTIVFFAGIRYRLRGMPLERDEGEYAYAGQLLLQGIPPYQIAYNLKLPGIYAAYAAILAIFGETPAGIHLGLLLVNAATTLLLFILATRLYGRAVGVISAASYALLSTSYSVMGFQAHATNFVILFAVAAILLLLSAIESKRTWLYFSSGILSGIAVLMKQHGAFLVFFCVCYLLASHWKTDPRHQLFRAFLLFITGVILPYAITCLVLYRAGVFHEFWFWTIGYANEYSKMGLRRSIYEFEGNFRFVTQPSILIWSLAVAGLAAIAGSPAARKHSRFVAALLFFSFLAICPGSYFRPHYFILLLPAIAILVGAAMLAVTDFLAHFNRPSLVLIPGFIFLVCFAATVWKQRDMYFHMNNAHALLSTYEQPPFLVAPQVAAYIERNSNPNTTIAVIGSEPEIYFYAHRYSATGYIYMYGLTEHQKYAAVMQQQMMHEIETNRPEYLVYVDYLTSWSDRKAAPYDAAFLGWLQSYMQTNYERVGVADGYRDTNYIWGAAAGTYQPHTQTVIYTLKRRP